MGSDRGRWGRIGADGATDKNQKMSNIYSDDSGLNVSNIKRSYIWPITRILRVMALFTCDITRKHAITRPYF